MPGKSMRGVFEEYLPKFTFIAGYFYRESNDKEPFVLNKQRHCKFHLSIFESGVKEK